MPEGDISGRNSGDLVGSEEGKTIWNERRVFVLVWLSPASIWFEFIEIHPLCSQSAARVTYLLRVILRIWHWEIIFSGISSLTKRERPKSAFQFQNENFECKHRGVNMLTKRTCARNKHCQRNIFFAAEKLYFRLPVNILRSNRAVSLAYKLASCFRWNLVRINLIDQVARTVHDSWRRSSNFLDYHKKLTRSLCTPILNFRISSFLRMAYLENCKRL